jgi:hypothetical protein
MVPSVLVVPTANQAVAVAAVRIRSRKNKKLIRWTIPIRALSV